MTANIKESIDLVRLRKINVQAELALCYLHTEQLAFFLYNLALNDNCLVLYIPSNIISSHVEMMERW